MEKRCELCCHWRQTSAFKNYDGGLPGRCLASIPLWVGYLYGTKSTDRIIAGNADARECGAFAEVTEVPE
jgi:hypothetical protein